MRVSCISIVAVSNPEPLMIANNKCRLLDFLKQNGLPCADYYAVQNKDELREKAEALGYPLRRVCVKATEGSGSRGFRILDENTSRLKMFLYEKPSAGIIKLDELLEILNEAEEFPNLLVMEYLPGTEYSVDLLADNGKMLVGCCRKSLRMENSIMLEAEIVYAPAVLEYCAKITALLNLDGNIGFDLKERSDGTPVVMECNPRLTAGVPFFALAGVNFPYLCIKKTLGEPIPSINPEYGTVIKRRWLEMAT